MNEKEKNELKILIVKELSESFSQEFANMKQRFFILFLRYETLLHTLIEKNDVSHNEFIGNIESFNTLFNTLTEINKDKNILSRVNKAKEFNAGSRFKITLDDLGILEQVSETGGLSERVKTQILDFPHSDSFVINLERIEKAVVN